MDKKGLQEFIYFFTHNKSLTRAQTIKRDSLLARDYSELYTGNEKQLVNENAENQKKEKLSDADGKHRPGVKHDIRYISPKNIQSFLREFNQDDVLKYTCHLIDTDEVVENICKECSTEQYEFAKHLELIYSHFENLKTKFKNANIELSSKMVALMSTYLTGKSGKKNSQKTWSSNKIDINWNCEQIHQWTAEHPHMIPAPGKNIAKKQRDAGFVLPKAFKSNIAGTRIKSFSELVIFFKSLFHLRQDNSLRSILSIINKQWDQRNVQISFSEGSFNDSIELFTDVDKLIQAYQKIINICIDCCLEHDSPVQIELSFLDDPASKQVILNIHHLNSKYKKTSKNVLERIGESQSELIENQINGLCDLYIEARFGDDICGIINLWNEDKELKFCASDMNIEGVKYILKF